MKTRQITGIFATEKYLPEPRIPVPGAMLRLRADLFDASRVELNAVPYLLSHDKAQVVGKVVDAWHQPGEGFRFLAELPVDEDEPIERVVQYLREFDQGIRGLFSPGYRITDAEHVGRGEGGHPLFDAAWMLSEISDMPVPADTDARADQLAEGRRGIVDDEVLARLSLSPASFQIRDALIKALSARRKA